MSTTTTLDLVLSDSKVQPGEGVQVNCAVQPWPDPKEKVRGVELELGYDSTILELKNEPSSAFFENYVPRYTSQHKTVSTQTISRSQLEPSGSCTITMDVPPEGPPSHLGFRTTSWTVEGKLVRTGGFDHKVSSGLEIGPLTAEQVQAVRPEDGYLAWMSAGRAEGQDLYVTLDAPTTGRGDVIRGKMILELDPVGFAKSQPYFTKRGARKAVEKADVSEVEIVGGELTLDCWRCCNPAHREIGGHNGRIMILSQELATSLPAKLEVGKAHEFPFEVEVPLDLPTDSRKPLLAPPTSYSTRDPDSGGSALQDEDFLWRLRAIVKTSAGQLHYQYSGSAETSPLRAATEVVVF